MSIDYSSTLVTLLLLPIHVRLLLLLLHGGPITLVTSTSCYSVRVSIGFVVAGAGAVAGVEAGAEACVGYFAVGVTEADVGN